LTYLVQAFDRLASRDSDLRLVLTGQPGWKTDELLAGISSRSVAERIFLPGYVDDGARSWLLRNASVFAYPSLYEGFGLPPLEAMSVGTPVVTTTAGAIPEVVGGAALMVAPRSVDELVEALGQVLSDGSVVESLVKMGYERAAEFSWDNMGREMVELYRRAVEA
jgi:glycosyltransferase involved in cell wall biosynthesis